MTKGSKIKSAMIWQRTIRQVISLTLVAVAVVFFAGTNAHADGDEIDLTYVWTAKPGMSAQLAGAYDAVGEALNANEPGLLKYEISIVNGGEKIVIHEVFENSEALAFHLSGVAAKYFPQLVQIATPGPFIFRGSVPEELQQAANKMNIGAIFTSNWKGFTRDR